MSGLSFLSDAKRVATELITSLWNTFSASKIAVAPISNPIKYGAPVSPKGSPTRVEEEVESLRLRNKVLAEALASIKATAEKEARKHYDLVWFARHRGRFPGHEARKRIEESVEHQQELDKLKSLDADHYHGVHCGLLAAARMFEKQADILHVNQYEQVTPELLNAGSEHKKKIIEAEQAYPEVQVNEFPLDE